MTQLPPAAIGEPLSLDPEFLVLHALRVRGFANADQIAESSGLDAGTVASVFARTAEEGHTRERQGRLPRRGRLGHPGGSASRGPAVKNEPRLPGCPAAGTMRKRIAW